MTTAERDALMETIKRQATHCAEVRELAARAVADAERAERERDEARAAGHRQLTAEAAIATPETENRRERQLLRGA